jgi:hypothetical protein
VLANLERYPHLDQHQQVLTAHLLAVANQLNLEFKL